MVVAAFSQASNISALFFSKMHLWMPFISRPKWEMQLIGPFSKPGADVKLLLFAMKLLLWSPGSDGDSRDPTTAEYLIMKTLLSSAESIGVLSLEMLQAAILLTIYEYAHTIYPAAYISIGTCVRYGQALGIDKQRREDMDSRNSNFDQQEERRRAWWAVVILDRVISRSHTGPEPRPDDLLPIRDEDWVEGNIDPDRFYQVSRHPSTEMGMFAQLAQAAFLLGRVYRWKNCPTGDAQFDNAEKTQLEISLQALINLAYEEKSERPMLIYPQIALCFNGLMVLHTARTESISVAPTAEPCVASIVAAGVTASCTLQLLRPIAEGPPMHTGLSSRREPWPSNKLSLYVFTAPIPSRLRLSELDTAYD